MASKYIIIMGNGDGPTKTQFNCVIHQLRLAGLPDGVDFFAPKGKWYMNLSLHFKAAIKEEHFLDSNSSEFQSVSRLQIRYV